MQTHHVKGGKMIGGTEELTPWILAVGIGGGGLAGYALGMLVGTLRGREQVIRRVRTLILRGKLEFDLEPFLRGEGERSSMDDREPRLAGGRRSGG